MVLMNFRFRIFESIAMFLSEYQMKIEYLAAKYFT